MMYISVYPLAISIRNTNVYEEKSLGLFAPEENQHASFVGNPPRLLLFVPHRARAQCVW